MSIVENLNKRLEIIDGEPCQGGEDAVKQVIEASPVPLPQDYIEFLKEISGTTDEQEECYGLELGAKAPDSADNEYEGSLWIFSAQAALNTHTEYKIDSAPLYDDIIDKIWLIGNDLGDLLYFYCKGKDGFGIYREEAGSLVDLNQAEKIADTLTDFLVGGTGIDTAITL